MCLKSMTGTKTSFLPDILYKYLLHTFIFYYNLAFSKYWSCYDFDYNLAFNKYLSCYDFDYNLAFNKYLSCYDLTITWLSTNI